MGVGNALGRDIFSVLTTEIYNHPVRSGLSFRKVKKRLHS